MVTNESNAKSFGGNSLRNLPKLRQFKRRRVSSYDRTGGNFDWVTIKRGETAILFDVAGPGCITHIWTTQSISGSKTGYRNLILRIWWDNEATPSVECPLTDFFGCGHGQHHNFVSAPLQMSPANGRGFNCWFPMPFKQHAKITLENDDPDAVVIDPDHIFSKIAAVNVYYYVDYEQYELWPEDPDLPLGYLHTQFRRVDYKNDNYIDPDTGKKLSKLVWQMKGGKNTRANGGYARNHVILEAKGNGQYVGCHIDIDNRPRFNFNWPGEGDDMIFIDDDIDGEPVLYGTGTEDYVNQAFCPQTIYNAPYHGCIVPGGFNWKGKITYYRYHIQDPIRFKKVIKVSIEHGHNNGRGDIWETTAYWYQIEPHAPQPPFPDRAARTPKK